jgi:hypothetical protein
MRLHIRYRSAEDVVTEREVSVLAVEPPNAMHAFCYARGEERTFVLDRIEDALDAETGEVIADIWLYLGLQSLKRPPPTMPSFPARNPDLSADELRNLRKGDKNALFRRFKLEVIAQVKRRQLWALFNGQCFKCGTSGYLELDHHIPQDLGGRLVPGNIVLLCNQCNLRKGTTEPRNFYTEKQLALLQPLLEAQLTLFDFKFNWNRWARHPEEYLVSLGATKDEARAATLRPDRC